MIAKLHQLQIPTHPLFLHSFCILPVHFFWPPIKAIHLPDAFFHRTLTSCIFSKHLLKTSSIRQIRFFVRVFWIEFELARVGLAEPETKKHPYICGGILALNVVIVTLVDSAGWLQLV